MPHNVQKYHLFTAEDFLSDTFFIGSVSNPTPETERFWTAYLNTGPANLTEFHEAKQILMAIAEDQGTVLSEQEIDGLLENIMAANRRYAMAGNRKKRLRIASVSGVAACIAVGVMFLFDNKMPSLPAGEDIMAFVKSTQTVDLTQPEVKLVLSDDKTVTARDNEPVIVYDEHDIKLETKEYSKSEVSTFNRLIVPYGKRSKLTLSDGTEIWVNAGTVVTYPVEFVGCKREIFVHGEIYLDVAHDPRRPFVVRTGNFDVEVLGTRFNVSSYKNEPGNVMLVDGSVRVSLPDDGAQVLLRPSEMFLFSNGYPVKERVDVEYYTSWVEGLYKFNNEPLDVILGRLSKYYGKTIECSPAVSKLKCSGKLDLKDNLDEILAGISFISSIKYTSVDDNYRVY